jgi:hypothetical protein
MAIPISDNLLSFPNLRNIIYGSSIPAGAGQTPFRPPQWDSNESVYIKTYISEEVVVNNGEPANYVPAGGTDELTVTGRQTVNYFFDAVLKADHQQALRITEHPVQTGANITDHAYIEPAMLVLEIGMSDAMDRYIAGQYRSNPSKSVSAYETLLELQAKRQPLTVTTRLRKYDNMLIQNINSSDNVNSYYGVKAIVVFKQIIIAIDAATKRSVLAENSPREQAAVPVTDKSMVKTENLLRNVPEAADPSNTADAMLSEITGKVINTTGRVVAFVTSIPTAIPEYMNRLYPYGLPTELSTMTYQELQRKGYLAP